MKKYRILNFLLSVFLLISVQILSGCGTLPAKKGLVPPLFTCDKKADDALKNKNYEKSIILHEFFLKENPDNGLAMYHTGFSYGQLGDHENEVKFYEEAIKLGYYGSGIFFNLGMVYGEMGKLEDSVRIFKDAIEVEPGRADNHFGLALVYQKMDSGRLAEKEFKRAIHLDPDDVDSIYHLGMLYFETGRIEKAKIQLKKLMEIVPDNEMTLILKNRLEDKK